MVPDGRYWNVLEDGQILYSFENPRDAEREMKIRQRENELKGRFDDLRDDFRNEIAALRTNMREGASEGGRESGRSKRADGLLRIAQAEKLVIETANANKGFSSGEIVKAVVPYKKNKTVGLGRNRPVDEAIWARWEGVEPYRESKVYTIILDLVDRGLISPPRDLQK
jgi:hypothetical protein